MASHVEQLRPTTRSLGKKDCPLGIWRTVRNSGAWQRGQGSPYLYTFMRGRVHTPTGYCRVLVDVLPDDRSRPHVVGEVQAAAQHLPGPAALRRCDGQRSPYGPGLEVVARRAGPAVRVW